MAAYAASVTQDLPRAERLTPNVGIMIGQCDITNYNSTLAEITGITGYFTKILRVINDGVSSNGYLIRWDASNKAFKAYYPTNSSNHTHHAIEVLNSEGGADKSNFVGVNDGAGSNPSSALDIAAGGGGSDFFVDTNSSGSESVVGTEAATDDTVGKVSFIAIGLMGA